MSNTSITQFIVNRRNFSECKFETHEAAPLQKGQVLMKIDKYAFTSNNISYVVIGERIGYWKFFPVSDEWGIVPVWGFADVVASESDEIKVGQRFYGYYPMSSHLVMEPAKVSPMGFVDGIAHRQDLPKIYNYYTQSAPQSERDDALQSLYRPLFTTSFLIDALFGSKDFFGSTQIILTSASSKTAYSLAYLLAERKNKGQAIKVIGLTSPGNVDFVKQLGFYDQVVSYSNLDDISSDVASSIVDFSGNHNLQYNLQVNLADQLKYNCLVGLVHWEQMRGEQPLPKKGDFFFAPTMMVELQKKWGPEGFQQKVAQSWGGLKSHLLDWVELDELEGEAAIKETYLTMLQGKIQPKKGLIIKN